MKIKLSLLLAVSCWLLATSCSKYKYDEVKGDLSKTRIYTLDNGLKVYLSVNKEKPRLNAFIAVRTGSKNDPAETTGLAHYLEHLMFKGTDKFGVTDAKAEKPLLDEIEQRYEKYRTLTDPAERRQAYHEMPSLRMMSLAMSRISPATRLRTGQRFRPTVSRIWLSVVSILSWKLSTKSTTSV